MKTKLAILTAALAVALPSYSQQTVFEYPDGLTVKFNPNGTRSGINVGALSGDPSAPNNGDAWYNALTNAFKIRANGQTLTLGEADLSNLNASNLTSGTVPDARFPATLPALNGSALTALNAGNLASGTIPDARFPATLPALSGVNLTALNASNLGSGTVPAARFPAFTGDVTTSAGGVATTLATVNANVGSFGSSTAIPTFTVNSKGLITAASTAAVIAPAGTLTGTTLAANVTASSLTSVGTVTSGTWNAGIIAGQYGGTGVDNSGKTLTLGGSYTINGTTGSTLDIGTGGTLGSAAFLTATAGGNLGADSGKVPTYSVDGDLSATTFRALSSLVAGTAGTGDGNVAFYNETNPAGILIVTAPDFTAQHVWTYPGDTSGTHASREWVSARNKIWYVRDYGAIPNDGLDDRLALQTAIDAAYAAGGGVVLLDPGIFRVNPTGNTCLLLKTGVKLQGSGIDATIIETDNVSSATVYNLISPYGWNVAGAPYSAHEINVADLTLRGLAITGGGAGNLHNLIAFANCPRGLVERVGFDASGAHYVEFNQSKECVLKDCRTVGAGVCASSKFQLDPNGQAGGNANCQRNLTITGAATWASGMQTQLTVNSTVGVSPGDFLTITGANGSSAAAYNAAGGWLVTDVQSATRLAINLPYPQNATTVGTAKLATWNSDNAIIGYVDKPLSTISALAPRWFLECSHNNNLGCFRRFRLADSIIYSAPSPRDNGNEYNTVAFDNAAYPMRFHGLVIEGNLFVGGNSGQTNIINLAVPVEATAPHRRVEGVVIRNNTFRDAGFYRLIQAGAIYSDTASRSLAGGMWTEAMTEAWGDVSITGNRVTVSQRGAGITLYQRVTRGVSVGACESLVYRDNSFIWPNRQPEAWQQYTVSAVDTVADTLTIGTHALVTGDSIVVVSTTTWPGNLNTNTAYAIVVDSTTIKVASTYANAIAGTAIDISSAGSGTITVHSGWCKGGGAQYGLKIDHALRAEVKNNLWQVDYQPYVNGQSAGLHPLVFACQCFEQAGYSTTISNAASADSGLRTALTVASASSFRAGDRVTITSANGSSAAAYNRAGGWTVYSASGVTLTLDMPWQGNATTAGTVAVSRPVRAHYEITGNQVQSGPATMSGIDRPFSEMTDASLTTWASATAPSVTGVWSGNTAISRGAAFIADTSGGAPHYNAGVLSMTTIATTAAESEGSGATKPRHRWAWQRPRVFTATLTAGSSGAVSDPLITAQSAVSVIRTADGGTVGSYTVARTAGTSFTITSSSGTDTSTLQITVTEP